MTISQRTEELMRDEIARKGRDVTDSLARLERIKGAFALWVIL